jgi:hypothetical protein
MTFEALEATKVGRAVNALRKSAPSEQARHLAAELYRRWKALADEHFATRQRARVAAAAAEAAAPKVVVDGSDIARPPPPPVEAKEKMQQQPAAGAAANGSTSAAVAEAAMMPPAVVKKQRNILRLVIKKPSGGNGSNVRQPSAVSHATTATASHQGRPAVASKRVSQATKSTASMAKQQAKPPPKTALITKLPPPKTAVTKPSGPGACKRKGAPAAGMDEARLAKAKKKLREGYKEASTAKEKRKIQVIEATPANGRPAPVSSCTTMSSSRGK